MYDLEKAIRKWVRQLRRQSSLEDGTIYEMELHLREQIEREMDNGLSAEAAFLKSTNDFGDIKEIALEEQEVRKPHRSGPFSLIRHYLATLGRRVSRHSSLSFIMVLNLSVGIALFMLSAAYIQFELSYDTFHPAHERIVRLHQTFDNTEWAATPAGVGPYIRDNFTQVEEVVRIDRTGTTVRLEEKVFFEENMAFADPAYPRMFHLDFIRGSAESALDDPSGMAISESAAIRYFGDTDPINQSLYLEFDQGEPRRVTGVYRDMPENSHLDFDFLISLETLEPRYTRWANFATYTYLKLAPDADLEHLEAQTAEEYRRQYGVDRDVPFDLDFIPVASIHLDSHAEKELSVNSDRSYLYIFGIAALLILLVSSINFINLSLVQTHRRGRELGMRKSLGASSRQLTIQLATETITLIFTAFVVAGLLVFLLLPWVEELYGGQLLVFDPVVWLGVPLALFSFLVLICGILPVMAVRNFRPVSMMRTVRMPRFELGFSRKALILFQFTTSLILIVGAITIYQQLSLLRERDMGFEKDQRVVIPLSYGLNQQLDVFKTELKNYPEVQSVTHSSSVPGYRIMQEMITPLGREEGHQVRLLLTSAGWTETYGLDIRKGRSFTRADEENGKGYWILNEEAARLYFPETEDFLGTRMVWNDTAEVIGVVENFHFQSLHEPITPLAIKLAPYGRGMLTISFAASDREAITGVIRETFESVYENQPEPELVFLDERFETLYAKESTLQQMVLFFTFISLLLTVSGIFAISRYAVQQKTKEIAIRKVLGGSTRGIVLLVSRNLLVLIGISLLIAIPVSRWLLGEWLDGFAFHVEVSLFLYVAGVIILALTIMGGTASTLWNAVSVNPAVTLNQDR